MKNYHKIIFKKIFVLLVFTLIILAYFITFSIVSVDAKQLVSIIYISITNFLILIYIILDIFFTCKNCSNIMRSKLVMRLIAASFILVFSTVCTIFYALRIENHELFHSSEKCFYHLFIINVAFIVVVLIDSFGFYNRINEYLISKRVK